MKSSPEEETRQKSLLAQRSGLKQALNFIADPNFLKVCQHCFDCYKLFAL